MTHEVDHVYGWSNVLESNSNRLKLVQGYKVTLSTSEADLWFKVIVERATPGTEVRGRIVGPRSLFARTSEVVSPLRSIRQREAEQPTLIARTAFPNPVFWDPFSPVLYRVVVELWQDGQRCEVSGFDIGFRLTEMTSSGVFVNNQQILLQGLTYLPESREEAADLRNAKYNLVLTEKGQWHCWIRANPMGFLLLERVSLATLTPQYIGLLSRQPCFLGFVLDKSLLDRSPRENESFLRPCLEQRVYIGLELDEAPQAPLPDGLSFLLCPESVLAAVDTISLPKLILRVSRAVREEPSSTTVRGVLGYIDT